MTNQVSINVFNMPGQLNARLEHLGRDRYHLFVNGRWTYAFYSEGKLMDAYRELKRQGHACTVVAAGEIFFYSIGSGLQLARFVTQRFGRYTAEYDRADGSLRLCWSGEQTFLSAEETRELLDVLDCLRDEIVG